MSNKTSGVEMAGINNTQGIKVSSVLFNSKVYRGNELERNARKKYNDFIIYSMIKFLCKTVIYNAH